MVARLSEPIDMTLALRPGLSFCDVGGKLVFLDLPADRYFCLEDTAERTFRLLVEAEPAKESEAPPDLPRELFIVSEVAVPIAPCAPQLPFLDDRSLQVRKASITELAAAAAELVRAPLALRVLDLNSVIGDISRRKARVGSTPHDQTARLDRVAGAFNRLRGLVSAHDRCLPRSIAIARRLAARGVAPTLTLGVKLRPFGAHCWVRCGDRLVSDRWDDVRHFTPIVVI